VPIHTIKLELPESMCSKSLVFSAFSAGPHRSLRSGLFVMPSPDSVAQTNSRSCRTQHEMSELGPKRNELRKRGPPSPHQLCAFPVALLRSWFSLRSLRSLSDLCGSGFVLPLPEPPVSLETNYTHEMSETGLARRTRPRGPASPFELPVSPHPATPL
jgi:hypothetical protein